jgi:hypothetical protein
MRTVDEMAQAGRGNVLLALIPAAIANRSAGCHFHQDAADRPNEVRMLGFI